MGIRVVMLGSAYVGKTSLTDRLVFDRYKENKDSTIGSAYCRLTLNNVLYDIWDTAGQERYSAISEFYYREADIIILVFDISNISTIATIINYYKKVKSVNNRENNFIIIGNKYDITTQNDIDNSYTMINDNFMGEKYIIISTKTGMNIDKVKDYIISITDNIRKYHKINNIKKDTLENNIRQIDLYTYDKTDKDKCVC